MLMISNDGRMIRKFYLRIPFIQCFNIDELFFTIRSDLNTVLFATNDDHLVVSQVPSAITVTNRSSFIFFVGLDERIWFLELVTFFTLDKRREWSINQSNRSAGDQYHFQHLLSEVMIDKNGLNAETLCWIHCSIFWRWFIRRFVHR